MIEYNERIKSMLYNILDNVSAIKYNMEEDGCTHYNYILEKLEKAKWDLDILVKEAQEVKYEKEN